MRIVTTALTILCASPFARPAFADAMRSAETATPPSSTATTQAASSLTAAPAAELAAPRIAHTHSHPGALYVNTQLGVGQGRVKLSDAGEERVVSGGAVSFSVAFGATVLPNLVLYGQVGGYDASAPKFESAGTSVEPKNAKLTQVWVGPGLTYYFAPINVLVGGSVGVSRTVIEIDANNVTYEGRSNLGPAFTLQLGKEWWLVNERLAFGVTAQALFATMHDSEGNATVTSRGLSVGVSASYN